MKTLKQILSKEKATTDNFAQSTKDLEKFVGKHEIEKVGDANGNGDDVFKGTNVKYVKRTPENHGYDSPKDASVHEELELEEKTLTKAEMKKREEVAKAIERENPKMPMSKKMAIATATAKRVAEEVEETTLEEDLIDLYFNLDEEARDSLISILQEEDDQMLLEFVESLED